MAITEFDLFRMQLAIDSSSYKTPKQRQKEQQQKKLQQLDTRRQAEYHVISQQFDTRQRKAFMDKYGQGENTSALNSNVFSGLDPKAIKNSAAARIDAQTQEQIDKIVNTPARQAFYAKYGQQNSLAVDTQAQIEKITNTKARQAFLDKYGDKNGTLQNDQVSLSQEALAKLMAEKFPAQAQTSEVPQDNSSNSSDDNNSGSNEDDKA